MKNGINDKSLATEFIKSQIRLLNGAVLLSVVVVSVMVLKLLYDLYTYLPMYSVLALLGIVVMLLPWLIGPKLAKLRPLLVCLPEAFWRQGYYDGRIP